MRVIKKEPGKHPELTVIGDDLKALQDAVGGHIEAVTFGSTAVICNDEVRLKGMEQNCWVNGVDFVGPVLIVGVAGEDFCDIPEKLAEQLTGGERKC